MCTSNTALTLVPCQTMCLDFCLHWGSVDVVRFHNLQQSILQSGGHSCIKSVNQAVWTNHLLRMLCCNPWKAANSVQKFLWQVGQLIWPHTHFFHQSIWSDKEWQEAKCTHPWSFCSTQIKIIFQVWRGALQKFQVHNVVMEEDQLKD